MAVWPVKLAPVGNVSMGSRLWRLSGQLMVTVVTKATFSFARPDGLVLVEPQPVRSEDEHRGGHPMRSVVGQSDVAPQLHRADVTLVGAARPVQPTPRHAVRLALANQTGAVLDKTLTVFGKREGDAEPEPFSEMALEWENAYGGIGHGQNPIGKGHGPGVTAKPNVCPQDGRDETVGFAPVPASFPIRRKLLDTAARKRLAQPMADLTGNVDWSFFQAAPADQRLAALVGNEWLALDGFSKAHPQLRMRLPGGLAVTRVYGFERAKVPNHVPLALDTLAIETDELRLSLTWRGSFPVMSDDAVDLITIAGTYLPTATAFEWPAQAELELLPFASLFGDQPPRSKIDLEGTTTIEAADLKAKEQTLPFAGQKEELPHAVSTQDLADHPLSGTVSIDGGTISTDGASVAMPYVPPNVDIPLDGTMAISTAPAKVDAALPFPGVPQPESPPPGSTLDAPPPASVPAAIPGAPWAAAPAPKPLTPPSAAGTLDLLGGGVPGMVDPRGAKGLNIQASIEAMARRSEEAASAKAAADQEAAAQKAAAEKAAAEKAAAAKEAAEKAAAAKVAEAKAQKEREAAERAHEEAEARRREEAEKFKREQEEAQREAERRAKEEAEQKSEAAQKLRKNMYGGFKRKS